LPETKRSSVWNLTHPFVTFESGSLPLIFYHQPHPISFINFAPSPHISALSTAPSSCISTFPKPHNRAPHNAKKATFHPENLDQIRMTMNFSPKTPRQSRQEQIYPIASLLIISRTSSRNGKSPSDKARAGKGQNGSYPCINGSSRISILIGLYARNMPAQISAPEVICDVSLR